MLQLQMNNNGIHYTNIVCHYCSELIQAFITQSSESSELCNSRYGKSSCGCLHLIRLLVCIFLYILNTQ